MDEEIKMIEKSYMGAYAKTIRQGDHWPEMGLQN